VQKSGSILKRRAFTDENRSGLLLSLSNSGERSTTIARRSLLVVAFQVARANPENPDEGRASLTFRSFTMED
jgi:hypothetical protein